MYNYIVSLEISAHRKGLFLFDPSMVGR